MKAQRVSKRQTAIISIRKILGSACCKECMTLSVEALAGGVMRTRPSVNAGESAPAGVSSSAGRGPRASPRSLPEETGHLEGHSSSVTRTSPSSH